MDIYYCICAAEKDIHNAKSYLKTGEAFNLVSNSLSTAILWAMEAWLKSHEHEIDRGEGWKGVRSAFKEAAPEDLKEKALNCLSNADSLDFFLFGDGTDPDWRPLPMDEWEEKAYECLTKTEKVVNEIRNEICSVGKG